MLISYITIFLEFICIYYTAKSFLQISYKPTKNDCIVAITTLLSEVILQDFLALSWIIGQLFYIIYITFIIQKHKLNGILLACVSFETILVLQCAVAFTISFLPIDMTGKIVGIIGNISTLLLIILVFRIRAIRDLYNKIIHSALPYRLILLNSYLILFIILLPYKTNPSRFHYNFGSILIIALVLVTANVCVLYYDQKMSAQQQQLLSYQKNLPIYESLITEIRDSQHEYSNRLQNLQILIQTCSDYETLQNALKKYTNQYAEPLHAYPLLKIDMPLLAASLYNLFCRAEKNDITIQFDVTATHLTSQATETQLSDYTSTLLQNAIEACKPGDNIYIYLTSQNGLVEFEVRNPVDVFYTPQDITKFFQKGFTTKHTPKNDIVPHGIGLYNLSKAVDKLKGIVGADCITYNNKNWIIFRLRV